MFAVSTLRANSDSDAARACLWIVDVTPHLTNNSVTVEISRLHSSTGSKREIDSITMSAPTPG